MSLKHLQYTVLNTQQIMGMNTFGMLPFIFDVLD